MSRFSVSSWASHFETENLLHAVLEPGAHGEEKVV